MKHLLLSIKEALRSIFGSNYSGHRRTMRVLVVVLNLAYVIAFGMPSLIMAVVVAVLSAVAGIAIGYGMEKLDDSLDNNAYNPNDMRGNVHGAGEGGVISIPINIIIFLVLV